MRRPFTLYKEKTKSGAFLYAIDEQETMFDPSLEIATIGAVSRYIMVVHSNKYINEKAHVTVLKNRLEVAKVALPALEEDKGMAPFKASDKLYTPDKKNPEEIPRTIHRVIAPWFLSQHEKNSPGSTSTNLQMCWVCWEAQAQPYISGWYKQKRFKKAPMPPAELNLDFYEARAWKLRWYQNQLAHHIFKAILKEYRKTKGEFTFDPQLFVMLPLLQSERFNILSSSRSCNIAKIGVEIIELLSYVPFHKIDQNQLYLAIKNALPLPFSKPKKKAKGA